ncbi:protein LBH [Dunckerocampus dactyliophorus]|uniref:protein LBH n=1 Tax=Dunckerocampus dactyliophorus TaxID=161453 RepID=UPI00240596F2|nr:protein LBH [Dunckerocampus dactyliophorus]
MTEVMDSLESGSEDFSGAAGGDQDAIFPDSHERHPKLSKRLPSIVVEPTDGAEVESGELRWPPEPSSPDTPTEPAGDVQVQAGVGEGTSGAEMPASN